MKILWSALLHRATIIIHIIHTKTRMWANAQRDGRLPNIGGASVPRGKVWLTPTTRVLCSNAAKTRESLKFAGVPKTRQQISAASGSKLTILWGHVGETLLFNMFLSDCRYMPQMRRYSPTKLCYGAQMANFWRFLGPAFPPSRAQHISELHSKFALGPHHVSKYGTVDIQSATAEIRQGKKERKIEGRNHRTKI